MTAAARYPDAFPDDDWLPLAREIAAGVCDGHGSAPIAALIRAGSADAGAEVQCALAALKWRAYAQPGFRTVRERGL